MNYRESFKHLKRSLLACSTLLALSAGAQAVVFQAESYNTYNDTTTGNSGGAFRNDNVDIEATADTGGGYDIGWIETGEWWSYSNFNVPTTGSYTIRLRVASQAGGTASVDLNGGAIQLGNFTIPATGGWQTWTTVSRTVTLTAGTYNLGVFAQTAGWNFNWIEIVPNAQSSVASSIAPSSSSASSTLKWSTQIQAEEYNDYYDTTPGNSGGVYRNDGVDIEATNDTGGGYNVGWIATGEWLKYNNVNIPVAGDYTIRVRVASQAGGSLSFDLNSGAIVLGDLAIPATGGWQSWTTVSRTVTLSAGNFALGVFAKTGGWNLNWIEISLNSQNGSSSSSTMNPAALNVVPLPTTIIVQKTYLDMGLNANVKMDLSAVSSTSALQNLLAELNITQSANAPYNIQLQLVNNASLGAEGYTLTIDSNIVISAQTDAGLFYGVQTLKQLLPAAAQHTYRLPQLQITDVPQYAWRGSMIDVARNFFTIEYLKKHVERMALFKLNKLHLHLSDDQGWRVEIKKYPKLTSIGGSTKVGGGDGGFYTQQELKDFVAFAALHQVEVIPEVDMPGHIQAAIASYNELACSNVTNLSLYTGVAVGFSSLCLTNPTVTYQFVEDVLRELTEIFPSQYLHIGGDEIKNDLYPQFIEKENQIVKRLNKTMIGWEESSQGNVTSDSLLQLWNDNYDIKSATDRNIHLILSPCSYTYLDHGNYNGQPDTYTWCRSEGIPLDRVYSFNPDQYSLVVGIESPMWSELVTSEAAADNRMWPRLAAIAELGWTAKSNRQYEKFILRLSALKPQLDKLGVSYYKEPQLGW